MHIRHDGRMGLAQAFHVVGGSWDWNQWIRIQTKSVQTSCNIRGLFYTLFHELILVAKNLAFDIARIGHV